LCSVSIGLLSCVTMARGARGAASGFPCDGEADGGIARCINGVPARPQIDRVRMGKCQPRVSNHPLSICRSYDKSLEGAQCKALATAVLHRSQLSAHSCCPDPGAAEVASSARHFRPPPGLPEPPAVKLERLIRLAIDVGAAPDRNAVCETVAKKGSDKGVITVSCGSMGHPDACYTPCRFFRTKRGCKDGVACIFCHKCHWNNSLRSAKNKAAALAKRDAWLVGPEGQS